MAKDNPSDRLKTIPMDKATKKRLKAIALQFKGKNMFPQQTARAKDMFRGLECFPGEFAQAMAMFRDPE